MTRILAPILLVVLLFPSFAQGQSLNDWVGKGKGLLCETTGVGCPESVDYKDLVKRDGLYYKKFTTIPFTGKVTGQYQGKIRNGKKHGLWVGFWSNGQLMSKGTYKDGNQQGPNVSYHKNGQLWFKGTYKDGIWDGKWVRYHENGQLHFKGTYKDGKSEGPWEYFNKDGTVDGKITGTYKNGKKISD